MLPAPNAAITNSGRFASITATEAPFVRPTANSDRAGPVAPPEPDHGVRPHGAGVVERVRAVEPPIIAVRRMSQEQHCAAGGHALPVELDIAVDVAADDRPRTFEPQHLLDRVGH